MTNKIPFSIQQSVFTRYLRWTNLIGWSAFWLTMYGTLSIPILIDDEFALRWLGIHAVWMGLVWLLSLVYIYWYTKQFVNGLQYELDGDTVRINEGVFTLQRKAIPLDRITDIMLTQGVIMRWFGIWQLDVQTASLGSMGGPEGTLYGIAEPKHVRDTLLAARSQAARN